MTNPVLLKPLHVHCGVVGIGQLVTASDEIDSSILNLPVLKAEALSVTFPTLAHPFQLIFTSKNAVAVFRQEFSLWNLPWSLCQGVGVVGRGTAQAVQEALEALHLPVREGMVVTPEAGHGLQALLEVEGFIKPQSKVVILTVKDGLSPQVLKNYNFQWLTCLPVYQLSSLPIDFSTILSLSKQAEEIPKSVIFHCSSGRVLRTIVEELALFYRILTPQELPTWVYFNVWGASTESVLKELRLENKEWQDTVS